MVEWMKNYSMVFLMLTALGAMSAKKEYRQYVQFFVELVLVLTLVQPFFKWLGKSEDFFDKIAYESFWQGMDTVRADQKKAEFLNGEQNRVYYKKIIETDIAAMAEDAGYTACKAEVKLNDVCELTEVRMEVAKIEEHTIVIGKIEEAKEDEAVTKLREKIAAYYRIDPDQIIIQD